MGRPCGCCDIPSTTTTTTTGTTEAPYYCWWDSNTDYICSQNDPTVFPGPIYIKISNPYNNSSCDPIGCPPTTTTTTTTTTSEPVYGRCCLEFISTNQTACLDGISEALCAEYAARWGANGSWAAGLDCLSEPPCGSTTTTTTTCEPIGCCEECVNGQCNSFLSIQSACNGTWTVIVGSDSCNPPQLFDYCGCPPGSPCETTTTTTPEPCYKCYWCDGNSLQQVTVSSCDECPPQTTFCLTCAASPGIICGTTTTTTIPPTTTTLAPIPTTTTTTTTGTTLPPTTTTTTTVTTGIPTTTTTTTVVPTTTTTTTSVTTAGPTTLEPPPP